MRYFWHGFAWHLGRMFAHLAFSAGIALIVFVVLCVMIGIGAWRQK